jgi:hypothetical protein
VFGHDACSGDHVVLGPGTHVAAEVTLADCVTVRVLRPPAAQDQRKRSALHTPHARV